MPLDNLIEENKPLAPFTTLGIGGPARWFLEARSEDQVAGAAAWALQRGLSLLVLGGGSNLLLADAGFDGLVVHVGLRGIDIDPLADPSGKRLFQVAAGEEWDQLVTRAVAEDCAGVECLAGIPGTAGGTPVQNVGAYGQEVATTIERVRAFDLVRSNFAEFTAGECGFAYRKSRFNTVERGRYVVTRVDFRLTSGGSPTLRYADLQKAFPSGTHPTLGEVSNAVRQIRRGKGMLLVDGDPDCRSAGSFFKNPVVEPELLAQVARKTATEPPRFPAGPDTEIAGQVKIPAAWLIEQAGFTRGYVEGHTGISSRHTLALINRGNATAAEVLALAEKIRSSVLQQFGICLEMEPVLVGF